MTQVSSSEWEFAIVLPLGAVANQLQKIEAQLRLLNMKALNFARAHDGQGLHRVVEARLEAIGDTLDSVATLIADIQADISPNQAKVTRLSVDEESVFSRADSRAEEPSRDDTRPTSARKPRPERDD